uniref:RRM domain-containing protein n=1 Tax=Caenorhabditis tropicalis TaxID=1561998 RepID=A0A1I7U342_9PELO
MSTHGHPQSAPKKSNAKHQSGSGCAPAGVKIENHKCKSSWQKIYEPGKSFIRCDGVPQKVTQEDFERIKRVGVKKTNNGLVDPRTIQENQEISIYRSSSIRTSTRYLNRPHLRVDSNYCTIPPKREVSLFNMDDNCTEALLKDFAQACGNVDKAYVCTNPKNNRHMKMAYVVFKTVKEADTFYKKYQTQNLLATKCVCKIDPFLSLLNEAYEKETGVVLPQLSEELASIDSNVLRELREKFLKAENEKLKTEEGSSHEIDHSLHPTLNDSDEVPERMDYTTGISAKVIAATERIPPSHIRRDSPPPPPPPPPPPVPISSVVQPIYYSNIPPSSSTMHMPEFRPTEPQMRHIKTKEQHKNSKILFYQSNIQEDIASEKKSANSLDGFDDIPNDMVLMFQSSFQFGGWKKKSTVPQKNVLKLSKTSLAEKKTSPLTNMNKNTLDEKPPPSYSRSDPHRSISRGSRHRRGSRSSSGESENHGRSTSRKSHRRSDPPSRSSNGDNDNVVQYKTVVKLEKRSIEYEAGKKKYEQVHIRKRTAVIRGKDQLEDISSDENPLTSSSSTSATYPESSDDERKIKKKQNLPISKELNDMTGFGWDSETDESDEDNRKRRGRTSKSKVSERRTSHKLPSSSHREISTPNTVSAPNLVSHDTPPPPPPKVYPSPSVIPPNLFSTPTNLHPPQIMPVPFYHIPPYPQSNATHAASIHPHTGPQSCDFRQPPPGFVSTLRPVHHVVHPIPQSIPLQTPFQAPLPQPGLVQIPTLSGANDSSASIPPTISRPAPITQLSRSRSDSPEQPLLSLQQRFSGIFGVHREEQPKIEVKYECTLKNSESQDDRHSLEDMDVEVSSDGETSVVEKSECMIEKRRQALERIAEIRPPIIRSCRHKIIEELHSKITDDIRQQIMRRCLAQLDEKLRLKAVADEEKRKGNVKKEQNKNCQDLQTT